MTTLRGTTFLYNLEFLVPTGLVTSGVVCGRVLCSRLQDVMCIANEVPLAVNQSIASSIHHHCYVSQSVSATNDYTPSCLSTPDQSALTAIFVSCLNIFWLQ